MGPARLLIEMGRPATALLCAVVAAGCGGKSTDMPDGGGGDMAFVTASHREPPGVYWQGDAGERDGAGATVIKAMRLVSIVAANDDLGNQLLDFGDGVGKSKWYAALSGEYGLGAAGPAVRITGPAINDPRVDDNGMQRYIMDALASTNPPTVPDGRTVILLYLPRATQFLFNGSVNECDQLSRDDKSFGAYHLPFGNMGDMWAPVMRCMLPKGQAQLDQLTIFATQQIADAITNPGGDGLKAQVKQGVPVWESPAIVSSTGVGFIEIGEMCSSDTRSVEGQSTYQRFFTNKGAKAGGDPCAPALAVPYYNVTTELDWYGGNAGDTITIELTGWSLASMDDWPIRSLVGASGDPINYATARVESETNVTFAGITYQTINNARHAFLKIVIPPKARSGWWNVVHVRSFRLTDAGITPAGEDYAHRWTVGAYVP